MPKTRTIENWWVDYAEEWWKEYPEVDREYITVYPCDFGKIDPDKIWKRNPVSFYVHTPFCASLCEFCVFPKYKYEKAAADRYLAALKKEISLYSQLPYIQNLEASALYFGGGTPTSLTINQLCGLVEYVRSHLHVADSAEITVEAYPTTANARKLEALHDIGINRISFGAQSFHDKHLSDIGLSHTRSDNFKAIEMAQSVGFSKVGIDLMYRLPGQSLSEWESDLETAAEVGVDSVSCYSFAVLPGTRIYQEAPPQPNEETDFQMYRLIEEVLGQRGYHQYTVADFALRDKESVYLNNIWGSPALESLGIGLGAISYLINDHAFWNIHNLEDYIEVVSSGYLPVMMGQRVSSAEMMSRSMVLGLRRLKVSRAQFLEEFAIDPTDIYSSQLRELESLGLISITDEYIALTDEGKIYVDNVSKKFFTPNNIGKIQPIGTELQKVRLKSKCRHARTELAND